MNKLSDRLRANVECAPWVVSEVVELETLVAQQASVLEAQKQEPFPFSAERVTYHKAGAIGAIMPCGTMVTNVKEAYEAGRKSVLEAQGKQEPVAWCVAYDDPRMGRIHSNPTMCEPEVDTHVSKCGGVVVKVPLFAAPVVQPDTVLVPRVPTEEMLAVIRNERGAYGTGEALYADLIAAAEGKA